MTRFWHRLAIVLVFVLLVGMLSGCRKKRPFIIQPATKHGVVIDDNNQPDDPDDITVTPVITGDDYNLIVVRFYTVNATNSMVKTATVMEREDVAITPEKILDYVIDSLEDESITLSYNSVAANNGNIIIDFDDSIIRISRSSADLEMAVLDAAAQSILDNIDGCQSIIYRINGGAYKTDNLSFGIDYSYMDY